MIAIYHFKTLRLAETTRLAEYQNSFAQVAEAIAAWFDVLIRNGNYALALRSIRSLLDTDKSKLALLEKLVSLEGVPSLVVAKARVSLSQIARSIGNEAEAKRLRQLSRPQLESQHAHEGLELDLEDSLEAGSDPSVNVLPKLHEILNSFIDMDYANGVGKVLYAFKSAMEKAKNNDGQTIVAKQLEEFAVETGTRMTLLMSHADALGSRYLTGGDDDLVRQSAKMLYEQLEPTELGYHRGLIAFVIGGIYIRLENAPDAEVWLQKSEIDWSKCLSYDISMARSMLLSVDGLRLRQLGADATSLAQFAQRVHEIALDDCQLGHVDIAMTVLDTLLCVIFHAKNVNLTTRTEQSQLALDRMDRLLEVYSGLDKPMKKAGILQQRANLILLHSPHRDDCNLEYDALECFRVAYEIYQEQAGGELTYQLMNTLMQIGLVHYSCFAKLRRGDLELAQLSFETSKDAFTASSEGWQLLGHPFQTTESLYWIALLSYEARLRNWESSEVTLDRLTNAERGFDDRRSEVSFTSGLEAVKEKQALSKHKHVRDIYRFSVQICLLDRNDRAVWQWVQKAKARSLSDTLGLGAIIPARLLSAIEESPDAATLCQQETNLIKTIETCRDTLKYHKRLELRNLQQSMRAYSPLRELVDIRMGSAIELNQLKDTISDRTSGLYQEKISFVDYFTKSDEIYFVIVRNEADPVVRRVNSSLKTVSLWVEKFLHTDNGREESVLRDDNHPAQPLRDLDSLIEFVPDMVPAGETILFSLTGILNSVPIHALHVPSWLSDYNQRQPTLIERNPVLYCSSLTAFVQCCRSAYNRPKSSNQAKSFTSVYEKMPYEDLDEDERDAAYRDARDMAETYNGIATTGHDASPRLLKELWPKNEFIYFHGHCEQSDASIVDQGLVLVPQEEDTVQSDKSTRSLLTVREFFDMRLDAPNVLFLACGSAKQQIELGDEPLGLVTALLCAGAASVVGTIWPVTSSSAREFAKVYLKQISQAQDDENLGVVNLARALQAAVVALKRDPYTRQPYHWAPYVLHGAWFAR